MFKKLSYLILFSPLCFSSQEKFEEYKSKISHLENSVIQEFSIDLPDKSHGRFTESYSKAATELEVKFEIQRKLFYKIEKQFLDMSLAIEKDMLKKQLTSKEAEKLKTNIEFASRIIMRSRKGEIQEMYSDLKKALTHNPRLVEVYEQLNEMKFNNCSLENLKFNEKYSSLSFDIKQKNKFGSWTTSNFYLTNNDVDSGRLISKPMVASAALPFQKFVTEFWTNDGTQNGQQKFTLHLDPEGEITKADFRQEYEEPLIEVFGFKIGKQSIRKAFGCNKAMEGVRAPASIEN